MSGLSVWESDEQFTREYPLPQPTETNGEFGAEFVLSLPDVLLRCVVVMWVAAVVLDRVEYCISGEAFIVAVEERSKM